MARRFMFVCLGILALAVAYHLGAETGTAQTEETAVGFAAGEGLVYVITASGNIYVGWPPAAGVIEWTFMGSWSGGATATQPSTWGSIKAQFRE